MTANARTTDPDTSKISAPTSRWRMTQKELLLDQFMKRRKTGLTSEKAAEMAGLLRPGICYWKRVSEMAQAGVLKPLVDKEGRSVTRKSSMGRPQIVYVIA